MVKLIGSDPYLRMLTRLSASAWVKPVPDGPLMVNWPEVSAAWVSGADWTLPSRTIAVESRVASSWFPVDAPEK